jgi:hypothetical protein
VVHFDYPNPYEAPMTSFTLRSAPAICSVIFFCLAQLSVFAQTPTPTPPEIVYKIRGSVCEEEYGGVNGSANCTPVAETINTNFSRSIVSSSAIKESSLNVTVVPTATSNVLQASMGSRLQRLHVGGPSFIGSTKAFLDVEVYVRDSPSNIYTIFIDGTPAGNQHNRPPTSGGFGCPCGTQNSLGSATLLSELTLYGTASELGSQVISFPEFPGVSYRLAYQRSQNDWDYVTSASGGVNDWDFDADLYADAFLSLNIYATSNCPTQIQLICRPVAPYGATLGNSGLVCPSFIAKHCYFLISFPDGHKETISAFPESPIPLFYGNLTPVRNGDPTTPPNGCISDDSDISKSFCKDLPLSNPCDGYEKLLRALQRGNEGAYSLTNNNSNTWVNRRLSNPQELGLNNCPLPPSAPTNATEYRIQRDKIRVILASECRVTEDRIEELLQTLFLFF